MKSGKVQPGDAWYDPTLVHWFAVRAEYGQINPGKTWLISRAPNYVHHIEVVTVVQQRLPVLDAHDSRHTLDAGFHQVIRLHADQGCRPGKQSGPMLATDWSGQSENVVPGEPHQAREYKSAEPTLNRIRNAPRLSSCKPRRM